MVYPAHSTPSAYQRHSTSPRFEIHADHGPQTLARIVGIFAAQNLVPDDLYARRSCAGMWIAFHIDMPAAQAERIAERLRALVCVEGVVLIPAPPGPSAPAETRVNLVP